MILALKSLPSDRVTGIYTIGGVANRMPVRALFLHPVVADAFLNDLADHITVSDMLRTAESSLHAVQSGRGAQPPGYSGHNYGFSIDIEVSEAIDDLGFRHKSELDTWMQLRGWYCHRRDGQRAHEEWHYNYLRLAEQLGLGAIVPHGTITSDELELLIQRTYGALLVPSDTECQRLLRKLRLYGGEVDGIIGPLTRKATEVFQRGWGLHVDGVLGPRTRRTLAFVAADRVVTP